MPENKVQITIEALDKTKAAFAQLEKELRQMGNTAQTSNKQIKSGADSAGQSIGSLIGQYVGLTAVIYAANKAMRAALGYLAQIETSTLGIATGLMTAGQFYDKTTGKMLTGQEKLNAAMGQARDIIDELQVENFRTIATLDQLVRAYQETLPVALQKGFNTAQVKEFTVAMVQAAGSIGLSLDMLAEETRSLIVGTITPRTSRIAVALGLTNEDIRQHSQNANTLFNFLMGKLAAYQAAGIESQKTWAGLWSNTVDIAKQAGGQVFEPIFQMVKYELSEIAKGIVTIDEKTKKIKWNPDFLETVKTVRSIIISCIAEVYRLGMLLDKIGGTLTTIQMLLTGPGAALGIESSKKRFEAAAKANIEFEKRYWESDKALQALANREIGIGKTAPGAATFEQKPGKKEEDEAAAKAREKAAAEAIKLSEAAADAEHKRWEDSAKAWEDFKDAVFEATATQYEKDLRAADEWLQTQRDRLNDAAIGYEEYQARLTETQAVAEDMRGIAYHEDQMRQVEDAKALHKKNEEDKELITNQTYDRMRASMSDFLYSGIAGELENFKEIWGALWKSLARIAADALAKDLFDWLKTELKKLDLGGGGGFSLGSIVSGLGSLLGFGGGASAAGGVGGTPGVGGTIIVHKGGYIPRFHFGGMSSDEIPAILQRGEYVVSRRGVDALDQINQGNVGGGGNVTIINNNVQAWDYQTMDEALKRNPSAITSIVIKNAKMGGEIRDMILEAVS